MNIKINKEEFEFLISREKARYLFGSRLYGTNGEKSDTDIMIIYDDFGLKAITSLIPIQHQFQYDDLDNNTQYVFTTETQFAQNLFSGDSTINTDILMLAEDSFEDLQISVLYSFKIIKAYLGFAKRDIANIKGKNKLFHVRRGLYTASCLLAGYLVTKNDIRRLSEIYPSEDPSFYLELEKRLRLDLHANYAKNVISDYNVNAFKHIAFNSDIEISLKNKFLKGINTREFKY